MQRVLDVTCHQQRYQEQSKIPYHRGNKERSQVTKSNEKPKQDRQYNEHAKKNGWTIQAGNAAKQRAD